MIINLTTDDGLLIAKWDIDKDFGDISRPFARSLMTATIVEAVEKFENERDGRPSNEVPYG